VLLQVHVKFVGNQDHLHDDAAQMASVWLCIVQQMACVRRANKITVPLTCHSPQSREVQDGYHRAHKLAGQTS